MLMYIEKEFDFLAMENRIQGDSEIMLFSLSHFISAQTVNVSGTITDENNEGMPGVTIKEVNGDAATTTNLEGYYKISVPSDTSKLEYSFIGYQKQVVLVGGRGVIDVNLKVKSEALDEVVVVGYGKSSIKELTGATVQVKGESVERLNIPRMDQALQGQVSGVTINTNSGSPGGSSSIRIRGLSTFGDNDPLILVDGVVYDSEGLNALNPGDIESINVLKDATAGIYGVRAANGVIIIETKKGRVGSKPKFEVGSYYGVQETANKLDLLNAAYIVSVADSNHSFASSSLSISSSLNFKENQGVEGLVNIPCKEAANNSTACKGEESKISSVRLSPLDLNLVTSAFLGIM